MDILVHSTFAIKPSIYRAVIDDVIGNIKNEFDEYGVAEDVLADLQRVSRPRACCGLCLLILLRRNGKPRS